MRPPADTGGPAAGGARRAPFPWQGLSRRAALAAPLSLAACALPRVEHNATACPAGDRFHLYASDWHTEVVVPAEWLPELQPLAPGLAWVTLGFGQRDFFMAERPGVAEALGAMVPSAAVIRAQFLAAPPAARGDVEMLALRGSRAGLSAFLAAAFAREADGRLAPPVLSGLPGRAFLPAARRYSLAYTCNTWTADALAAAGLAVSAGGVVRREQVMGQARRLACA